MEVCIVIEIAKNNNYSLSVDTGKNRLYIKCIGFWNEVSIVDNYMTDQKKALAMLKPNFTAVADMLEFKPLPKELEEKERNLQKELAVSGMYKVAEILPDSVIAAIQLKNVTTTTNMPNRQFSSQADGEKWLDEELKKL
jgi:hypothetical protein